MHRGLPLAPYFPSNYPTNSHNAHELFDVGRLEQLVIALPLHLRNPAMSTIFVEADQHAKNSVGAATLPGRCSGPSTSTRRNSTACATSSNCAAAAAMLWLQCAYRECV
ncbi:LOB domain-containing protein 25-like [Pyrus ussuriensis x Pyrus communis]|uniref:LOB domain-containing protein 25-like n=1 Tax=Pyrus ussuriensis x Pyrus communis TaxID=2448454 RepID=A0A5N5HJ64_9ROSA|nr:LOB domain-containing protein 25-like [Pyrus ussuriensis x Pyrus communis]